MTSIVEKCHQCHGKGVVDLLVRMRKANYSTSKNPSATASTPLMSPFSPRHLMSIADLTASELTALVRSAHSHKRAFKSGSVPQGLLGTLTGKNVAMIFDKRSTRTRVSTESAVTALGGSSMFLGKEDIQLGVNESLRDTSTVISSMVAAIVARLKSHEDISQLAKYSSVPVLNALSDDFHPLQAVADCLTIFENFQSHRPTQKLSSTLGLGLEGIKISWVGDCNNVLFDLAIAASKLGMKVAVASPKGYEYPQRMKDLLPAGVLTETRSPEEALKDADVVVTDTWTSMGWEDEKQRRLAAFEGYQITADLVNRSGAQPHWKFMHCLPRHPEEVSDDVFYDPERSLVFPEAENRLWGMIAVLEAFVVNKGNILS